MKTTAVSAIHASNSQPTRDELIAQGLSLVRSIAARLRMAHGLPASMDDLCAAGFTGLLEAVQRFDPSRGVAFTTFAYYRIRGAIIDLRRLGGERLPCLPAFRTGESGAACQRLALAPANDNARHPENDPPPEPATWTLSDDGQIELLPFDQLDAIEGEGLPRPDEEVQRQWDSACVRAALPQLTDRERRVIELHYYEEKSFAEIAVVLGISKAWAFVIHERAVRRLREALGADLDEADDDE